MLSERFASWWPAFVRWWDTSLTGALINHAIHSVVAAGLFSGSYTVLHILLPEGFWAAWIHAIDGVVLIAIFLFLGYNIIVEFWDRRPRLQRGGDHGTSVLASVAF